MADTDSKVCRVCGQSLHLSLYHRNPTYADGLASICKPCHNRASSERYHRTKVLRPQSPIAQCAHCGKDFHRPVTNPPRGSIKHCSVECRFWSKVDKSGGSDACWIWTAKARSNDGKGYGAFNDGKTGVRSHRFAWELTHGPIPDGLHVCHKCDNPLCCNPAHFFLGTPKDNHDDMVAKGRHKTMSPELVERLRQMKIGKKRPPEVVAKMRLANLGRKQSEEEIRKRAEKLIGQKRSEETRQRMREAQQARFARERAAGH